MIGPPLLTLGYAAAFGAGAFRGILAPFLRGEMPDPMAADWAGGVAGAAIFTAAAGLLLAAFGNGATGLFAAFAVALNLSYAPAKAGCIAAGCCTARRPLGLAGHLVDLRVAEIGLSAVALGLTALVWPFGLRAAASIGIAAHVAIRLVSRHARAGFDRRSLLGGQEFAPLALCLGLAVTL
ncbi:MAG: hypothetical protein IPL47_06015 [Phyllobacteriaceae bacterium]|nr:hypothetical protein [Phyllobacteriaceae bacterium]